MPCSVARAEVRQLGEPIVAVNFGVLGPSDVALVKSTLMAGHRKPAIIERIQNAAHSFAMCIHQDEDVGMLSLVQTLLSSCKPFVPIPFACQSQAEGSEHLSMLFVPLENTTW
jgi:hypothetical protein